MLSVRRITNILGGGGGGLDILYRDAIFQGIHRTSCDTRLHWQKSSKTE